MADPMPRRLSVEEYERMVETGVLLEDDRVELIEGEILEMPPPSPGHSTVVWRLARVFFREIGDRAVVRVQDAIRLPPRSEPEPDIVLARPPGDRYLREHPGPRDVLLVVEVAHTSVERDRELKMSLYGRQGIAEAWVVNLPGAQVERYTDPGPEGYGTVVVFRHGDTLSPAAFPEAELAVGDLLP